MQAVCVRGCFRSLRDETKAVTEREREYRFFAVPFFEKETRERTSLRRTFSLTEFSRVCTSSTSIRLSVTRGDGPIIIFERQIKFILFHSRRELSIPCIVTGKRDVSWMDLSPWMEAINNVFGGYPLVDDCLLDVI